MQQHSLQVKPRAIPGLPLLRGYHSGSFRNVDIFESLKAMPSFTVVSTLDTAARDYNLLLELHL